MEWEAAVMAICSATPEQLAERRAMIQAELRIIDTLEEERGRVSVMTKSTKPRRGRPAGRRKPHAARRPNSAAPAQSEGSAILGKPLQVAGGPRPMLRGRLVEVLRARGQLSPKELGLALEVDSSAVHAALGKLMADGDVVLVTRGIYRATSTNGAAH